MTNKMYAKCLSLAARGTGMMNFTKISPNFSVTGQISGSDAGVAAAQGFKTIICNRPDDEAQRQPAASEIAAAAEALGIEFLDLPGPILAYCQTGTRSVMLWALVQAKSLDVEAIFSATKSAGYDLTGMRPRLLGRQ